ncbi:MAG: hypothetical protein DCC55_36705 [Chloroflexi bacterium]|nr:MAG: hypothetical protein DCC55_36705 [Chloroflexota bacterium]
MLLDKTGNVASEVAYYPFGLTRYEHNGDRVHYRFTGQEQDASGLLYYNARYYEPVTGRFISVDPLFVESPLKGIKNPQLLNLYAYALNNPGRYTDPDGTEPKSSAQGASMEFLREHAGYLEKSAAEYGYDPDKLLRNPRLSPEMIWQLKDTMAHYHIVQQKGDLDTLLNGVASTAQVVRAFDSSDRGSIYDLGIGLDVKIYDRQGRYVDPTSDQGQKEYATFTGMATRRGFTVSMVSSENGQGYLRLQYTPNYPDFVAHNGKIASAHEVNSALKAKNWHMQDLRKWVWRGAHGSYWRLRYAMNNPIRSQ